MDIPARFCRRSRRRDRVKNLSVVIPSKTATNFVPCAEAVRRHEPEARIILIDDGMDLSWLPRPDLMPCIGHRTGLPFVFSRNVNAGIKLAERDDVVVLNDDALLETPGGFSLLQKAADEHPEFGLIGAVTNVTGASGQFPQTIGLREVSHIAFVCVLIPRKTIERVGLLDERYCLDYGVEDRDYCEICLRAGLKIGVHDFCYVDHGSLRSTFRGDPYASLSFARNLDLFNKKWGHSS